MPVKPQSFLEEARSLAEPESTNEIRHRTSINRSYYAAYHHLLETAKRSGFKPPSFSAHAALIEWMMLESSDGRHKKAGKTLREMKKLRVNADYALSSQITHIDTLECLKKASHLIEKLLVSEQASE
ncbi:putative HEPN domain-containing protein [Azospirillaceae bacterium]